MVASLHAFDSSRSLADATPGDLVEVGVIAFEFVRSACWHLAIRPGEILQCVEHRPGEVLAARRDGARVRVPFECARFIGVRRLDGHLDIRLRAAARAGEGTSSQPSVQ